MVIRRLLGGDNDPNDFERELSSSTGEEQTVVDWYQQFQIEVGEKETVENFVSDLEDSEKAESRIFFRTHRRESPFTPEWQDEGISGRISRYAEAGLLEEFRWGDDLTFYTFTERGQKAAENGERLAEYIETVEKALSLGEKERRHLGDAEEKENGYDGEIDQIGSGEYVNWKLNGTSNGAREPIATEEGMRIKKQIATENASKGLLIETVQSSDSYEMGPLEKMLVLENFDETSAMTEEQRKQKANEAFQGLLEEASEYRITEFGSEISEEQLFMYEKKINKLREGVNQLIDLMSSYSIESAEESEELLFNFSNGMMAQMEELGFTCMGDNPNPEYTKQERARILNNLHVSTKELYQELGENYF